MKKRVSFQRAEFILAVIIAALLLGSLFSEQYLHAPPLFTTLLILAFVGLRIYDMRRIGGSIFEDYTALAIIVTFGIINLILREQINSIIIMVIVFVMIYSVGLIPWIDHLLKSKRVVVFIISYGFFVTMIILLFAGAYYANHTQFLYLSKPTTISFPDSLYYSAITFTTVGYGDFTPIRTNKFIAALEAMTAILLNIAFIGYILASQRFRSI